MLRGIRICPGIFLAAEVTVGASPFQGNCKHSSITSQQGLLRFDIEHHAGFEFSRLCCFPYFSLSVPEYLCELKTPREQISDSESQEPFCQNTGSEVYPKQQAHIFKVEQSEASQVLLELPVLAFGLFERPHTDEVPLGRMLRFSVPGTDQELPGWTDAIKVAQGCLGTPTKEGHAAAFPQSGGNMPDLRSTSP